MILTDIVYMLITDCLNNNSEQKSVLNEIRPLLHNNYIYLYMYCHGFFIQTSTKLGVMLQV